MKRIALIVGAGFSYAAGLPLGGELLAGEVYASSDSARQRFRAVWECWTRWHEAQPDRGPEQFLQAVYERRVTSGPPWAWAAELVGAVLATPRGQDWPVLRDPRYAGRITTPVRSPTHNRFWDYILSHTVPALVVTTNYDLLIERGLRHRAMQRARPGIHYGGFERPQVLRALAQPFSVHQQDRLIELTGTVPLFKLHGSLNWSFERGSLVMYQDGRAAFRRGGEAAIVPPLSEKEIPKWLANIWRLAQQQLQSVDTWLVCGYSLPSYDLAARELFTQAGGRVAKVYLLDPSAQDVAKRWRTVAPSAQVVRLPGLPDALDRDFL